jgi:ribosomal protein L24E
MEEICDLKEYKSDSGDLKGIVQVEEDGKYCYFLSEKIKS